MPNVNTACMNVYLKELSEEIKEDFILIMALSQINFFVEIFIILKFLKLTKSSHVHLGTLTFQKFHNHRIS